MNTFDFPREGSKLYDLRKRNILATPHEKTLKLLYYIILYFDIKFYFR